MVEKNCGRCRFEPGVTRGVIIMGDESDDDKHELPGVKRLAT